MRKYLTIETGLLLTPFIISACKAVDADGFWFNTWLGDFSYYEIFIFPMLSFVVLEIYNFRFRLEGLLKEESIKHFSLEGKLKSIEDSVQGVQIHNNFNLEFEKLKHPYFKRVMNHRFEDFIKENADLFNNRNVTKPAARDTFGEEGIRTTKETLYCVSSISDYWSEHMNDEYLRTQEVLIKKGVAIKRLFVFNDGSYADVLSEMARQIKMGIEVRAVNEKLMSKGEKFRDYLIQDGKLLVDLVPLVGVSGDVDYVTVSALKHLDAKEVVTFGCKKRVVEFESHWARGHTLEAVGNK